jgi:hypothetical protein
VHKTSSTTTLYEHRDQPHRLVFSGFEIALKQLFTKQLQSVIRFYAPATKAPQTRSCNTDPNKLTLDRCL